MLFKVRYPDHHDYASVRDWVRDHCQGKRYSGIDWDNWIQFEGNRMYQFESEQDAVLFALRWS